MLPPSVDKQLVMACHLTGVYDVNRNNTLPEDDYDLVKDWVNSLIDLNLKGILFHNNFTETTCEKYQNKNVAFVKVAYDGSFNPNVYRYFVYQDFLRIHFKEVESVFITDVSDVVATLNPFVQSLFVANPNSIFCGDEPKILDNEWMKNHAAHLRNSIGDYAQYEEKFQKATLLNCGIIGGNRTVMQPFIDKLCHIHRAHNHDNKTAYTGDMGAFNYLIRTQFNGQLQHGSPVNTVFKEYQSDRTDCWFRHK